VATGGVSALLGITVAVYNLIAADLGTNDFSGGAANYGRFPSPPMVPFIAFDTLGVETEDDSAPLGTYEHTATFFLEAWANSASDSMAGPVAANLVLSQEIQAVIHDAFLISGGSLQALGVRRVNFPETEYMNTEINNIRIGHVRMTLEITYTTTGGL